MRAAGSDADRPCLAPVLKKMGKVMNRPKYVCEFMEGGGGDFLKGS